jgi:hypothetical protein
LGDLGFKGSKFTWRNHREGQEFIKERLDRALANAGWCAQFSDAEVVVMAARVSDHKPLWIRLSLCHSRPSRTFKFEASWNVDEESAVVIKAEWDKAQASDNLLTRTKQKLEQCATALSNWNHEKFGDNQKHLTALTKKLEALQADQGAGDREQIRSLQGEINLLLEMEDLKWKQRAKRNWFKGGVIKIRSFFMHGRHNEEEPTKFPRFWMRLTYQGRPMKI